MILYIGRRQIKLLFTTVICGRIINSNMQVSPLIYTKNVNMFNCAKHNNELNAHYLKQPISYSLLQDSSDTHLEIQDFSQWPIEQTTNIVYDCSFSV